MGGHRDAGGRERGGVQDALRARPGGAPGGSRAGGDRAVRPLAAARPARRRGRSSCCATRPELLAIADASRRDADGRAGATRRDAASAARRRRRRDRRSRWRLRSSRPWSGRGGLVDRALAAIGSGEVIHVVETTEGPGRTVVDLRTGAESPVEQTREIWFDDERGLLRSVQRIGGTVTSETLETPQGAWTRAGRVYTCAWIAAHPVEATKARVSCNPSGKNGTTPRHVPEPRPVADPRRWRGS